VKVVLLNIKYSPNLGDGVIAECLEHALRARLNDADIESCDLSGRAEFNADHGAARSLALRAAPLLPQLFKNGLFHRMQAGAVKRTLMPIFREKLAGVDVAIFGGGQLFSDSDLNFPMKIAAAAAILHDNDQKFAIHSVGVDEDWSNAGDALFKEAFVNSQLIWASVRDDRSRKSWNKHFQRTSLPRPRVSLDPGFLAPAAYGAVNGGATRLPSRPIIGLCVTAPATISLYADRCSTGFQPDADFYVDLAAALNAKGYEVLAFTNGAPEDDKFLRMSFSKKRLARLNNAIVEVAERGVKPGDLVATIKRCQGVIAHRLHANIVAYAYQIPHVGLSWNARIDEFFHMTGRSQFVTRGANSTPATAANMMEAALAAQIPDELHHYIVKKTNEELDALALAIKSSVKNSKPAAESEKLAERA